MSRAFSNGFISETNCQFQMALLSILAFFLFCHLPLLNSAEEIRNNSNEKPICPPSFNCKDFRVPGFPFPFPFSFLFYNSTVSRCGLMKLNCNEKVPQLQLSEGGQLYDFKGFVNHDAIRINDKGLQGLLDERKCDSLRNFSLPNSPSISFTVVSDNITLFRCPKTSDTQKLIGDDYHIYSKCNKHNFYYIYPVHFPNPQNLPDNCSVIQLPKANLDQTETDASELFELSAEFTLQFHISSDCYKCHSEEGQCQNEGNEFHCANAKGKGSNRLILETAIPGAGLIFFLVIIIIIWRCKKWSNLSTYFLPRKTPSNIEDGSSYYGVPVFSYKDLEDATHNFDPSKKLGDGGFGTVYHGKLRDGREVAVKRLYEHNYKRVEQFMNEIDILTRLRHRSLVLLYGSTSHHSRVLLLVYEYIPNGTVADHLHGDKAEIEPLTWPVRMNIAIETASALSYLHKSDTIHRDVKTNNILLDNNYCVKVADFGLSRLFPNDVSHVSTAPQGTPGYVDPEYHQCYQLTDKSDVYSFGVVLIELISSLPAVDISRQRNEINLANLAIDRIQRCAFNELIDPSLGYESDANIERMTTSMAELAFRCLQLDRDLRPTMDEVLDSLMQIQGVDASQSGMPPPSPESENVILSKEKKLQDSPVGVADKWTSSRSTTPSISTSGW